LTPQVFWAMTPPEFEAIGRGRARLNRGYKPQPVSRDEYEDLKRMFPDG
jgi:hypothetical protein